MVDLKLAGTLQAGEDGAFTLTLKGSAGPGPPVPPPITNAIVITPTGGDDRNLIQQSMDDLPTDATLMLSGMFNLSDTVWFRGFSQTICGDTTRQSGIRSTNAGIMSGPYASMFCVSDSTSCRVQDLEFDGAGHPTELLYVERGDNILIERCYLHDVAVMDGGPPFGAIHSEGVISIAVRNCRVERTAGFQDKDQGVRGIWVKGHEVWVDACNISDTGHTGIATEGGTITISRSTIHRALTQGTAMKMCQRPYNDQPIRNRPYVQGQLYCAGNSVDGTKNGGLMLESCEEAVALVEKNVFKNCGSQGSRFGAIYSPYAVKGLTWRNNEVENCRSFGALLHARGHSFSDTTFQGENTLWLEDDCHGVTLTRSGRVNVGSNCSEITVDGVKVA